MKGLIVPAILLVAMLAASPARSLTFTVDSLFDTGDTNPGDGFCEATTGGTQCTLRAAIEEANAGINFDVIEFDLGLVVINVSGSPLPTITNKVRIDGRTAPGFNDSATDTADAPPSVYINGGGLGGTTADGFRIVNLEQLVEIHAIGIINFPDNGVEVINSDPIRIDGNWIGTARNGAIAGNGGAGIYLDRVSNSEIGKHYEGEIVGLGNLVSNNGEDGIFVTLGGNNVIGGNYIGLDVMSGQQHGNGGHGVNVISSNNDIGVFVNGEAAPNFIWNNAGDGVHTEAGNNDVVANNIQDNAGHGVSFNGSGNRAGINLPDTGNYITGNGGHGILVGNLFSSSSTQIRANRIIENGFRGIYVAAGDNSTIQDNVVNRNASGAIRADTGENSITQNQIGVFDGAVHGNGDNGIIVNGDNNTVSSNDIAGVDANGIQMTSGNNNQILNNRVGVGPMGEDWGNARAGIRVGASANNTLVSTNVVGHNTQDGLIVLGSDTEVTGNLVGVGPDGENWGNGSVGVRVLADASDTVVSDNAIGHNTLDGVLLAGSGNVLCDNKVGLGPHLEPAGNGVEGILLQGGGNIIGDVRIGCGGNTIGNSASDGIQVNSDANVIRNNAIGGLGSDFGNSAGGILLTGGAALNEIARNFIRDNADDGVRINTNAGTGNRIQENAISNNGGLPIDINLDGVTANDPGDDDSGPNNVQNYPAFDLLLPGTAEIEITYRVNSSQANATYPLTVDFYVNSIEERGGFHLFSDTYDQTPDSQKTVSFDPMMANGFVMGTVTDANNNTSEFSLPVGFSLIPDSIMVNGFEDGL